MKIIDADEFDYILLKNQEEHKNGNRQYSHGIRDARKLLNKMASVADDMLIDKVIDFVFDDDDQVVLHKEHLCRWLYTNGYIDKSDGEWKEKAVENEQSNF